MVFNDLSPIHHRIVPLHKHLRKLSSKINMSYFHQLEEGVGAIIKMLKTVFG